MYVLHNSDTRALEGCTLAKSRETRETRAVEARPMRPRGSQSRKLKRPSITSPYPDFASLAAQAIADRNARNSPRSGQLAYRNSGTLAAAKYHSADRTQVLYLQHSRSRGTVSTKGRGG